MKTATTWLDFRPAILCLFAVLALVALRAHAQLVNDGETNVLNNVTNIRTGNVTIGTNGSNTGLILANGALLSNTLNGIIGQNTGANSNYTWLTGSGTRWFMALDLYVGSGGVANRMVISNDALVANRMCYIGYGASCSNNGVTVCGASSVWSNASDLVVGLFGSGNALVITNGGAVFASNAFLGFNLPANNNRIEINSGNLIVSNGTGTGLFDLRRGTNQFNSGLMDVDRLLMTSSLGVFEFNGGTLITRGGFISNGAPFAVGANGNASAVWDVRAGVSNVVVDSLIVGSNAPNSLLLITNGATLRGSGISYIGYNVPSTNNSVIVSGVGSVWSNASDLRIGEAGSSNILSILDGGLVRDNYGYIGHSASSSNNAVTVSGAGSTWITEETLNVGFIGSGSSLSVLDGGCVRVGYYSYIGWGYLNSNNAVLVSGAGSMWSNGETITIGWQGHNNCLSIVNGGTVSDYAAEVGSFADYSYENTVLVSGVGSVWNSESALRIGFSGHGNTLSILDGGVVRDSSGYVGYGGLNSNNAVLVSGAGSMWNNTNELYVGRLGSGNSVSVENGGLVEATQVIVGASLGISNNLLRLANGTLTASGGLMVNTNNTLAGSGTINGTVINGGTLSPGSSPGLLTINGNLFLTNSSRVNFELGGTNAGVGYDQITVSNFVQFAGTLGLSLTNGFLPAPGDSFTLVRFASSFGIFNNAINGGRVSLANGLASFHANYDVNLVLSDVQYVDNDGDGQGDLQELAAGTDPNDPFSVLAVTSVTAGGNVAVQFRSVAGKTYRIEHSASVGSWSVATTNVPATGTNTTWIDDGSLTGGLPVSQRFYRVGLQ